MFECRLVVGCVLQSFTDSIKTSGRLKLMKGNKKRKKNMEFKIRPKQTNVLFRSLAGSEVRERERREREGGTARVKFAGK